MGIKDLLDNGNPLMETEQQRTIRVLREEYLSLKEGEDMYIPGEYFWEVTEGKPFTEEDRMEVKEYEEKMGMVYDQKITLEEKQKMKKFAEFFWKEEMGI